MTIFVTTVEEALFHLEGMAIEPASEKNGGVPGGFSITARDCPPGYCSVGFSFDVYSIIVHLEHLNAHQFEQIDRAVRVNAETLVPAAQALREANLKSAKLWRKLMDTASREAFLLRNAASEAASFEEYTKAKKAIRTADEIVTSLPGHSDYLLIRTEVDRLILEAFPRLKEIGDRGWYSYVKRTEQFRSDQALLKATA